jgi:tetratricopeptide (TPR) repeat protein
MDKNSILQKAKKFITKGQIDKGIAEYLKILEEDSNDGNLHNTVGDLYLRINNKEKAADHYKKAADFFKIDGFMTKAIALYKKTLNIKPKDIDTIIVLAELDVEKGLAANACVQFLKAAELYMKEGSTELGLDLVAKVNQLSPNNKMLIQKIAELYLSSGLNQNAATEFVKIAASFLEQHNSDEARRYYQKALEANDKYIDAILGLATLEQEANNHEAAFQYIKRAVQINPNNIDTILTYANLSLTTNNIANAKEALGKVKALAPNNREAKKLCADILIKEGNLKEAWKNMLPLIDEALAQAEWTKAYEMVCHFKKIDPIEVGKRLFKIFKNTKDMDAAVAELRSIAEFYEKNNRLKEALQVYSELSVIDAGNSVNQQKIQQIRQKLGLKPDLTLNATAKTNKTEDASKKSLEDAIGEIDVLINYELYQDALAALEALKADFPNHQEIKKRMDKLSKYVESEFYEDEESEEDGEYPDSFEEDLAEADFYAQNGFVSEAIEIYERLIAIAPGHKDIIDKLAELKGGYDEIIAPALSDAPSESAPTEIEGPKEEAQQSQANQSGTETSEAVSSAFQQFKQSVEKAVDIDDYDTHYDLGIAYREMGMIDDAIEEFRYSGEEPRKIIKSVIGLAMCYQDKELYGEAIEEYAKALQTISEKDDGYLDVQYSMADAYEKNNDIEKALSIYKVIVQKDPDFRDVSEKIAQYVQHLGL